MRRTLVMLCLLGSFAALAQEPKVPASNPQFNALKSLAGDWEMKMPDGKVATQNYRLVSDGSAIILDQNVPGETANMITMFHPDGQRTVATHYCAMGNQPRMVADVSNETKNISFNFKDITNDDGKSGSMRALTVVLIDKDHHNQVWTWRDPSGKEQQETFRFERSHSSAQGK
jgi:hypothetical protein